MIILRRLAGPSLAALALLASLGVATAGGAGEPERGAGASGRGDGSGMGQDNSEIGTPKGPGDKPAGGEAASASPQVAPPADDKGLAGRCDDGRPPVDGACAR